MTFKRSFTSDSRFNKIIPSSVPVDPNSAQMIGVQAKHCHPPTIGNPVGNWAIPWSEAEGNSPIATIRDAAGNTVRIGVDVNIGVMAGDDAAIIWRDFGRKVEISTFETNVPRLSNGKINVSKPITCSGFGIYYTDTNGLSRQVGGDRRNTGHRGIPPSIQALHPSEVDLIERMLKTGLGQPADHPGPNFPMYGIESPRDGGIPEGANVRYMGPIRNSIQKAAHDYGFIVGDTGNEGTATVKTVQGGAYSDAVLKSLDGTNWDQWVVMKLGWR